MRTALAFLTPLPVGAARPDRGTLVWFPFAGAAIGLAVGGTWWLTGEWWPPLVAAALTVAVDVALTGALHLDGLADTSDGLLPHLDGTDRRRAVMAAPDVGAFGVGSVAVALLLRVAVFASVEPDVWLVAAVWAAARTVMAVALARGPYVGGGLGSAFAGASAVVCAAIGAALSLGLAALDADRTVAVVVTVLAGLAVVALSHRRLGGVTGDVLGAAGVVGETLGLVAATATW